MHKNTRTSIVCLLFVIVGMLTLILPLRKPEPRQAGHIPDQESTSAVASKPMTESPESDEGQELQAHDAKAPEPTATNNPQPLAGSLVETDASEGGSPESNLSPHNTAPRPASLGIASFTGSTASGGSVIGGGWQEADGSRAFCFASPRQLTGPSEGALQVSFMLLIIPPGASIDPTWSPLLESDAKGIHRNALTQDPEQYTDCRRSLSSKPFAVLSSPLVTVADGGNGAITVASKDKGVLFSFVATKNADSGEINLSVSAAKYEGIDPMQTGENNKGEE
jgi:hypothetical protein